MARPRSPGSRDSPGDRSPSSAKRSRLSSPTADSPGGVSSIQSPSSLASGKYSSGTYGTLRSDAMTMDLDGRDHHRSADRERHHRERDYGRIDRDHRDRHYRDRSRDYERDHRDRYGNDRSRDYDRERDYTRESHRDYSRSSRDRDGRDGRDRHSSRDRRDRERGRDREAYDRERSHGRERYDRDRNERSDRTRSSSRPLDDRERSSTPTTTGSTITTPVTPATSTLASSSPVIAPDTLATSTSSLPTTPVVDIASGAAVIPVQISTPTAEPTTAPSTPTLPTPASREKPEAVAKPTGFTPISMTPQAPKTLGAISIARTPLAARPMSTAFADLDAAKKRRENVMQWKLGKETAKQAEGQPKPTGFNLLQKTNSVKSASGLSTAAPIASKAFNWDEDDENEEGPKRPSLPLSLPNDEPQQDENDDVTMGDNDEDENQTPTQEDNAMDEDEVDPLDAFMVDVTAEVKQLEKQEAKRDVKLRKAQEELETEDNSAPKPAIQDDEDPEDLDESSEEEDILAAAAKRIKKKDIPTVDHSKIQYEYFRKDFYLEPPEMADMTPEEIHSMRLELDGIKIRGADCPKPIRKWTQAGLPPGCMQVIKDKLNYAAPTSIQSQAIPAIMSGRDVIAVAKTGSGKTIAFILPMLRHIKDQRPLEGMEGPIAIIMTPTRELAVQIHKECKNFLKVLNLRAVCAYGGSPIKDQIAELKRGAEIVVCTPGRLIDLLCANSGRVTNLRRTTFMVLDEADRMFDMGFEPQVMKIVNNVRPQRQVVLFSATFPKQMEALARKLLKRPLEITVGARSVVADDVTQVVEVREDDTRFTRLLEILGQAYNDDPEARVLIFVSRQEAADNLLRDLNRRGYLSMSIHGGKDQVDRDSAISDFKAGVCQILIATSVAARGLDVKKLGIVINYECPNHMEDYVHRVGRTGRAGNKGIAYTFITPEQERFAPDIAKALTNSSRAVPPELQALVDSFHEKLKSGDAKQTASGFGGKGLEKFEKERDKVLAIQKKTYGGGDDEGSDGEGGGDGNEIVVEAKQVQAGITAGKAAANAAAAAEENADGKTNAAAATGTTSTTTGSAATAGGAPGGNNALAEALRKAKEAADALSQSLGGDGRQRALEVINNLNKSRPGAPGAGGTTDAAGSLAGSGGPGGPGGPGGHRDNGFAIEIEINDYPPKARLMVIQKMMIDQISDHSGAAITTRGVFVEQGKQPPPGERKLYLFIEGDSQLVIDKAKNEITRILREEANKAADATNRGGGPGRGGGGRFQIV
ncbi:pre-mRNA processing RNA-helicase [Linnemannia schmuckeri]|uniref:RNA helicase n=1 Tax=Linnemannia schmuckeri TaxID=64567 RepID=A0A9P5RU61_9FUNG|nr:pre-mRNA processing RNA-helicase [Linnemannia schmuckeri]